jgi:hypothetical protein
MKSRNGEELKDGEQVLLRGSAGALFRVTVGQPFTRDLIEKRLASGEWSWPGETPAAAEQGQPEPRTEKLSKPAPGEDSPKPRTELKSDRGDVDEPGPQPRQETVTGPDADDPDRPSVSAPKSEWVVYAARTQHMSREDAANYTKADLIDMTK